MAEPITYQVLRAVAASLARIRVAAGYYSDAGVDVRVEPHQARDTEAAFLVVSTGVMRRPTDPGNARTGRDMTIRISARLPAAMNEAELRLHEILEDIDRAMADQQSAYPDRCSFPQYVDSTPLAPADGLAWVGVDVTYQTTIRRAR